MWVLEEAVDGWRRELGLPDLNYAAHHWAKPQRSSCGRGTVAADEVAEHDLRGHGRGVQPPLAKSKGVRAG